MLSECGPLLPARVEAPLPMKHLASRGPSTRAPKLALSEVKGSGALAQDDSTYLHSSDIQVLHVEGIVLDELAAGLYVFAHEGGEDGLALGDVFQLDLEQGAALGIHGRLPELHGAHLTQALVALDGVILAALVEHV